MRGLFIVLEGIEGSGKTTQVPLLSHWMTGSGIPHVAVREPGGTPVGEEVRQAVLHSGEMPPRSELLLYLTARAALVETVIRPALGAGHVVLADRYALSSFAYQAYGRGLPLDEVRAMNAFATGGLWPDLTVVVDVPLEEGIRRRAAAKKENDRIEKAGREFHGRVAEAYRLLASTERDVVAVDGMGTAEAVFSRLRQLLQIRFPETFGRTSG